MLFSATEIWLYVYQNKFAQVYRVVVHVQYLCIHLRKHVYS